MGRIDTSVENMQTAPGTRLSCPMRFAVMILPKSLRKRFSPHEEVHQNISNEGIHSTGGSLLKFCLLEFIPQESPSESLACGYYSHSMVEGGFEEMS